MSNISQFLSNSIIHILIANKSLLVNMNMKHCGFKQTCKAVISTTADGRIKDQPAMNRNVYKALRATAMTAVLAMPFASNFALAQTTNSLPPECSQYSAGYNQKVQEAQAEAERRAEIMDKLKKQPDWMQDSDGLLTACSNNNWPKVKLSNPLLSSIVNGVQDKAVKSACNQARQAISKGSSSYKDLMGGSSSLGTWSSSTVPSAPSTGGTSWGSLGGISAPSQPPTRPGPGIPGVTPPKP